MLKIALVMRATVAEISLKNLTHNIGQIKAHLKPGVKLCIAVKADAYGHGAVPCARTVLASGADFLAVATVDEGMELRNAGIQAPILVLSLCTPSEVADVVRHTLTPLVFDEDYILLFAQAARRAGKKGFPVHLAVDTGMGRIGCFPEEASALARLITEAEQGSLSLGGMCTHFAASDSATAQDADYTKAQFERFTHAIEQVRLAGIAPGICHCANSAASLEKPEYHLDMARSGITAYGYYPDGKPRSYYAARGDSLDLRPVMTLSTQVVSVRRLKKGMSVSYGHTWTAPHDTYIGVLPVGYADGLLRRFAPFLRVAVGGKSYPVRGRICMDQCMIELGPLSATEAAALRWQRAVLFGDSASGALCDAQLLADETGTISYEVTSAITKRVPRVFDAAGIS